MTGNNEETIRKEAMRKGFQAGVAYGRYRGMPNKQLDDATRRAADSKFDYWYKINFEQ